MCKINLVTSISYQKSTIRGRKNNYFMDKNISANGYTGKLMDRT